MLSLLAFGLGLLPGVVAWRIWRGPRVDGSLPTDGVDVTLPESAVLRDGAVGATRWGFAAMVVKLACEGHCTLVRTRKRRWFRVGPVWTVDLHADPTVLSSFELTVLRQLGRHDTLNGFGFAGSTFRRRTLRDVRADLVERGWLSDRHKRSNVCLILGAGLLGIAVVAGLGALMSAAAAGLGAGSFLAAVPRYPLTENGAHRRAAHRAYAQHQCDRLREHLSDAPERAASLLMEALPHLILERLATPRTLNAVSEALSPAERCQAVPSWIRDEEAFVSSADRDPSLENVLTSLGAIPLWERLR